MVLFALGTKNSLLLMVIRYCYNVYVISDFFFVIPMRFVESMKKKKSPEKWSPGEKIPTKKGSRKNGAQKNTRMPVFHGLV